MSVNAQEWMARLERLRSKFRSVQSSVREGKSRGELYGSGNIKRRWRLKKDVEAIEGKISHLDEDLSRMELDTQNIQITSGELSRRRGLLTRLKNEVVATSNILARSRAPQREDEFDFATPQVEESLETRHLSNQQLMERHNDEEFRQDQHLEDILRGVSTLKDIGYEINNELSYQGDILDGLENGIDKTDLNIQRNTNRVQHISMESTSCWPMFIMIFLLFVIVL